MMASSFFGGFPLQAVASLVVEIFLTCKTCIALCCLCSMRALKSFTLGSLPAGTSA
jgi:hypothetical protein